MKTIIKNAIGSKKLEGCKVKSDIIKKLTKKNSIFTTIKTWIEEFISKKT